VASVFSTPLPQVLAMKKSSFNKWHDAAQKVWDATRLKFE